MRDISDMELIAIIILFGSAIGIGIIAIRKIPALVELPVNLPVLDIKKSYSQIRERVKFSNPLQSSSVEVLLQKILSRMRVLTLKIESLISVYLQRLREKYHNKKAQKKDNYWQELNGSTKSRDEKNSQK